MKKNIRVLISGKVQGVWFRANTKSKAEQLGLFGWVRNTLDGRVEAEFEGEEDIIQEILEWCKKGPPLAKITGIEVKNQELKNDFYDFKIRY